LGLIMIIIIYNQFGQEFANLDPIIGWV
jgi:hypothetical protein